MAAPSVETDTKPRAGAMGVGHEAERKTDNHHGMLGPYFITTLIQTSLTCRRPKWIKKKKGLFSDVHLACYLKEQINLYL